MGIVVLVAVLSSGVCTIAYKMRTSYHLHQLLNYHLSQLNTELAISDIGIELTFNE